MFQGDAAALPSNRKLHVNTDWAATTNDRPVGRRAVPPDRILSPGTLTIDGGRIVDIRPGSSRRAPRPSRPLHRSGVHRRARARRCRWIRWTLAARSATCPPSAAPRRYRLLSDHGCVFSRGPPRVLVQVADARAEPQPEVLACCQRISRATSSVPTIRERSRSPVFAVRGRRSIGGAGGGGRGRWGQAGQAGSEKARRHESIFDLADILREIERAAPDVGIVTLAPELDGGSS